MDCPCDLELRLKFATVLNADATAPVPEPINSKLEASLLPELLHDAGMPADVEIPHAAASV